MSSQSFERNQQEQKVFRQSVSMEGREQWALGVGTTMGTAGVVITLFPVVVVKGKEGSQSRDREADEEKSRRSKGCIYALDCPARAEVEVRNSVRSSGAWRSL